ncbi:MAG TPA: hypothetical protein VFA20_16810 [Myxococcaceae bacterium]|nr:hypothetical protein [Myxococcaceae bacterium]
MSQDKLRDGLVEAARRRRARDASAPSGPDALAPLDAEAKDRIAARVMEEIGAPAAQVIPFRRRLRVVAGVGGVVAALAAALVVFLRPAGPPPLPAYEATFSGESAMRGTEPSAGPPRVGPGSALSLVARPRQPVQGPVEISTFLVRGDSARTWVAPQVSPERAVRIAGQAEALLPPEPGPLTAVIVIQRPGAPRAGPQDALRLSKGEAPADPGAQVVIVRFEQTGP